MPREAQIGLWTAFIAAGLAVLATKHEYLAALLILIGVAWAVILSVQDKRTLQRSIASIRPDFDSLEYSEKLVLRHLLNRFVLTEEQANQYLKRENIKAQNVLSQLNRSTPFLLPHFSGQFSINEAHRRPLERLLKHLR